MHTRTLGQNLEVSALGMGAMGLSFGLGPAADKPFFDTAEACDRLTNEELVGEAFAPVHERAIDEVVPA